MRTLVIITSFIAGIVIAGASVAAQHQQQQQSAYNFVMLAAEARDQGQPTLAKSHVDRAARFARSAQDWYSVADVYQTLGYTGAAQDANQRAEDALRAPRGR